MVEGRGLRVTKRAVGNIAHAVTHFDINQCYCCVAERQPTITGGDIMHEEVVIPPATAGTTGFVILSR